MDENGKKLLSMLFRAGEKISVSPNMYAYDSIPLEEVLKEEVLLIPTPESAEKRNMKWEDTFEKCPTDELLLVALNPIDGYRQDANCKAYRNFLLELDVGDIAGQIQYIKALGTPYSSLVFSGSKSVHTVISLDTDLPSEAVYRVFAEWMLNIATLCDQNIKNPSRSTRIPGAYREPGKKQELLEYRGPVKLTDFVAWLHAHPDAKPTTKERKVRPDGGLDIQGLKPWVANMLVNGLDPSKGRNRSWFFIACEIVLTGASEDETIELLERFFVEDRDFKRKEFLTAVRSAFKYINDRK